MFNLFQTIKSGSGPFFSCYQTTHSFQECFYRFDAIVGIFLIYVAISFYCLVAAQLSGNYSKVDQLWSILPVMYCWMFYNHWTHSHNGVHERLLLLCIVVTIWGLRLTYNFWRRDGYGTLISHEEDYRWPILRKKINNKALFALFNATFIAPYQNLILMLMALPAYNVMNADITCNFADFSVAFGFLALLIIESIADQQQWNFHKKKHSVTKSQIMLHPDPDVRDGFLQSGLFRFCRHPNYFAEQAQWFCVYLFTLTHSKINSFKDLFNWYGLGVFLLVTLFQGSMNFSESITLSKYPAYKSYQSRTNQCIPNIFQEDRNIKNM